MKPKKAVIALLRKKLKLKIKKEKEISLNNDVHGAEGTTARERTETVVLFCQTRSN